MSLGVSAPEKILRTIVVYLVLRCCCGWPASATWPS